MAKVKIQGNASGTGILTVTAPNTSTDRTITLPDSTGTLLTADGDGSSLTGVADATKLPLAGGTMTGALTVSSDLNVNGEMNLTNSSGINYIDFGGSSLKFRNDNSTPAYEDMLILTKDGSVEATHNGSKKFETTATGIAVTGGVAIGGTGTANTLDDYEEGTWTPVVTGSGGAPSSSTFHTNPSGKYTKVGRLVTVQFYLHINSLTGGSGTLKLTGVPFTPMGASGGFKGTVSMYYANASSNSSPVLQINSTGAFLAIEVANGSGGYLSNVSWVNAPLSAFASGTAMSGTVTFMAA